MKTYCNQSISLTSCVTNGCGSSLDGGGLIGKPFDSVVDLLDEASKNMGLNWT